MTLATDLIMKDETRGLLNWDHDVNPTSKLDFIENVRTYVSNMLGWERSSITIKDNTLRITVMKTEQVILSQGLTRVDCPTTLLVFKAGSYNETYGRTSVIGLGVFKLTEMLNSLV